ncbi:hypothetical protein M9H77_09387 [Catharanthus roseus]|uniref:Uncharacterized protein n=1 Tax=Catharanthus roseus TaxID=4058 RepID=A0ACC0C0M8_CATRO|nr:hypothetical protein M9H77_09387 [Catharanthus roseus]
MQEELLPRCYQHSENGSPLGVAFHQAFHPYTTLACLLPRKNERSFFCKSVGVKTTSVSLRPGRLSWSIVPLCTCTKGSIILVKEAHLPFAESLLLLAPCLDVSADISSANVGFTRQNFMVYFNTWS